MRFEITAPAVGFNGEVAGVNFSRGRATADSETDAAALSYFRRKGYTVVPVDAGAPEPADEQESEQRSEDGQKTTGRPPQSEPKAVWQEYARGLAQSDEELDAIDGMTKEQLIETYGKADQA
ncbi:hypothetical protein RM780_03990 [Streptomyces sp. DSM 44917]|uniref:Uncharacterized protein n=1 Tax=Streptomyces boetiae TaxID=3075541 RepID=A0ABU2L3J2_9ACTN|nr:hypothetical protein [Streptomyces sp. DSM 44917]MDT0306123.1 hypothetical protein [Streptomyces sp. DSM 44917]